MLIDSFGRTLDYLRVSVTDRCNLRCLYCMPAEGVSWKPHKNMLSFEEILRVVKIMSGLGVRKIRITGGEPLLRRGIASFLKELKAITKSTAIPSEGSSPEIKTVTLTTNGLLLGAYLDEAESMGNDSLPDGINISLNAIDTERYNRITRGGDTDPKAILLLIDRLLAKNITVKINCVPVRSFNEEEILSIAALARDKNIAVRFIELMSLGTAAGFRPIPGSETAARIEKAFGALSGEESPAGAAGPAVYYSLPGFTGKIGFINAVTQGFCETCNRLRLTSKGFLKLCLSNDLGLDLREPLRGGVSDSGLAQAITEAAAKKPRFHSLSEVYGAVENHTGGMSGIGG